MGASALAAGSADALSQFVAWPGLLAYQGQAKALYDGAELNLPTFHGVTVREDFAEERPAVLEDFLQGPGTGPPTTCDEQPVAAAESVAEGDRPAGRGRLPLQRRERHRHLRPVGQAGSWSPR